MEEQSRGFRGTLVGVSLPDIIQLLCTSTTENLKIKVKSDSKEGIICISSGQIVHAQTLAGEGESAFYEILSWPEGEFIVVPTELEMIGKISIHKPWQQLILEAARLKDENHLKQRSEPDKIPAYCEKCEKRFLIPSEKIPIGKKARLRCPNCQNMIEVSRDEEVQDSFEVEIERWKRDETTPEDFFLDGREGVLVCSSDEESIQKLLSILSQEDYNIKVAKTGREAFRYLREGYFQTVVLDETIGRTESHEHSILLYYIQKLPMNIRRRFFLCLLSSSLKTRDKWAAFRLGADLIINKNSLELIDELLHYSLSHKRRFYAPFLEELQILRAS